MAVLVLWPEVVSACPCQRRSVRSDTSDQRRWQYVAFMPEIIRTACRSVCGPAAVRQTLNRSKPGKIAMRLIVVRRSSVSIAFRREVLFEDGHHVDNAIEVPRLILPARMVNGIAIWMFVPITAQEGIYGVDRLAQHCGQVFNGAKRTGRCQLDRLFWRCPSVGRFVASSGFGILLPGRRVPTVAGFVMPKQGDANGLF